MHPRVSEYLNPGLEFGGQVMANENEQPKKPQTPPQPGAKPGQTAQGQNAPQKPASSTGMPKPQGHVPPKPLGQTPGQPSRPVAPGGPPQPGRLVPPARPPVSPTAITPPQGIPKILPQQQRPAGQMPPKPGTPVPGSQNRLVPPGAKPGIPVGRPATPPGAKSAQPPVANKPAAPGAKSSESKFPAKPTTPPSRTTPGKPAVSVNRSKPAPVRASTATKTGGRRIGQVLVDLGFIDDEQLFEVLEDARTQGVLTGQAALQKGLITEQQLYQALAEQYGMRLLNIEDLKPTQEAMTVVNETMSGVYKVLPLSHKDNVLTVVVSDPLNLSSIDDLRNFTGIQEITVHLALPSAMQEVLARCYKGQEESIMDIIKQLNEDETLQPRAGRETSMDMEAMIEQQDSAPVRKLLNMVLLVAIKERASDIHFEPFEEEYRLRYRADGVMYDMVPPPRHLAAAISTRIKVMANLDIAERRLPQDGRIELNVGGNPVDLRVSILPTMFGESCVIRVLDRGNVGLDLNRLGMEPSLLAKFRDVIKKPNGIFLVTGPTGSGKTTTLYSALNELNEITDKIITTEDPIEYDIDGIVQVPINSEIGVTFAASLRAILRQDPDKILVGEIRDLETAQIAVQAALTGHMVFSTLHTNDAPGSITRMRDMGLETFLITATLEGILAQRLVRRICEVCRTEFEPSPDMLMELGLRDSDVKGRKFYYGRGCERCNKTGYKGRQGIYELVVMNDELRDLVSAGASTDQLRNACRKHGMVTLREAGLEAIYNGSTTIDEIVRETVTEDD
jgi:type IV pilus assembly protein PilB